MSADLASARRATLRRLRRDRPRSRFARASAATLASLAAWSLLSSDVDVLALSTARRRANLERFLERDALPFPLRESGFSWSGLLGWARALFADRGAEALAATFWISALAIVLAGFAGWALAPLCTRTLMAREPYLAPAGAPPRARGAPWRLVTGAARGLCVLLRALPEYALAFLLIAILGSTPWPLVLALAIHNAGILGRLSAETLENVDRTAPRALSMLGAGRAQLAWTALRPQALPRLLLYFFYRYETCVRESAVLGLLGVVSLGYWIQDARARQRYDEMLFFVALGAALVLAVDLCSYAARRFVRGAA